MFVVYLSALISMLIVGLTNEELAKANLEFPEEQKSWDKTFLRLTLPLMLAIFIIAGLDYRWGWSDEVTLVWRIESVSSRPMRVQKKLKSSTITNKELMER